MNKVVRVLLYGCALLWTAQAFAQDADPPPVQKTEVPAQTTAQAPMPKGVAETQKGRGTLFVKEDSWDFGYVAQDVKVTHEFLLQNVGSDTLFIERLKPTCGCTSAPLLKDKLAPGEQVPVEVSFGTKKFSGPVRKTVTVISSDDKNANRALNFSAIVGSMPPTLGLVPESGIDFDRFSADESKEARVTFTNFSPTAVGVKIVGEPPAYLKAQLSSAHLEPKQSAELILRTQADEVPLGKFSGAVTLMLEGDQNSRLTIPVTGVSMMK